MGIEASAKKGGGVWVISTWVMCFISFFIYLPADVEEIIPPAREHPHANKKKRGGGAGGYDMCHGAARGTASDGTIFD